MEKFISKYTGQEIDTLLDKANEIISEPTGHVDSEGLMAIGWTDEDIAYFQTYGVYWDEADDEKFKVPDYNKAIYGEINSSNIQDYKDQIVYLPKIDTSNLISANKLFYQFYQLMAIPKLDFSNVTTMYSCFDGCVNLIYVPSLDTSKVTSFYRCFNNNRLLRHFPELDTSKVESFEMAFYQCLTLRKLPMLNCSSAVSLDSAFYSCWNINELSLMIGEIDGVICNSAFRNCYNLKKINLSNKLIFSNTSSSSLYTFYNCCNLENIPDIDILRCTGAGQLFTVCTKITSLEGIHFNPDVTNYSETFSGCSSLVSVPDMDFSKVTAAGGVFMYLTRLNKFRIKSITSAFPPLTHISYVDKESLLYMIDNATPSKALNIQITKSNYDRLSVDSDIINALSKQALLTLTSL